MVRLQGGWPTPLSDADNDVVLFTSEDEAKAAARKNMFGERFGFEVYEW